MTGRAVVVALVVLLTTGSAAARPPQVISFTPERANVSAGDRVALRADGFTTRSAVRVYLLRSESKANFAVDLSYVLKVERA